MTKVCKFGGTSMANAQRIARVGDIVGSDTTRKIVVVSAPGARFAGDVKITDLLYKAAKDPSAWALIIERFDSIAKGLGLQFDIEQEFDNIKRDIQLGAGVEYIISRGEYLMAKLFAQLIGGQFVDAKDLIMLEKTGKVDLLATRKRCKSFVPQTKSIIVVPGFYGSYNGRVLTLGRGGSDTSGAILSYAMCASLYENWTDVDGFFAFNPIYGKSHLNCEMSYSQAVVLAQNGAGVLHPDSCVIAALDDIPIHIKNSFFPNNVGTEISNLHNTQQGKLVGISCKKGFWALNIKSLCLSTQNNFNTIAELLSCSTLNARHINTDCNTTTVVFDRHSISKPQYSRLKVKLKNHVSQEIKQYNIAIIKVVGNGIYDKLTSILKKFEHKIIFSVATSQDCTIAIKEKSCEACMKALYEGYVDKVLD